MLTSIIQAKMHALNLHAVNMTSAVSPDTGAQVWRGTIMLCYPAILLVAFILSAAACSILSSRPKEEIRPSKTSEGKLSSPVVPKTRANRLLLRIRMGKWARGVFQAISLLVVLTFVVDAVTLVPRLLNPTPTSQCGDDEIVSD
jgi:hypothetical protein